MDIVTNFLGYINKKEIAKYLCLIISGFSIISIQKNNLIVTREFQKKDNAELGKIEKKDLKLLKIIPSFGFDNLIANVIFLDHIQYFGDNLARDKFGYQLTPDYFEAIVNHDPRFVEAYLHLAPASTLFAGQPQKTVEIISEGLKSLTPQVDKSYLIWTYKGIDELLFLGDIKAAQNSYATGAEWASYHTDERSQIIGNRAKETSEFLASNPDSKKAQASSWMMLFTNSKDRQVRNMALQRIKSLGGKVEITENKLTVTMPEDNQG
ncbi:MAG: hypothetical protein AAGE84_24080 [Cyanobacteria bacterium P01_G01_bin.39]